MIKLVLVFVFYYTLATAKDYKLRKLPKAMSGNHPTVPTSHATPEDNRGPPSPQPPRFLDKFETQCKVLKVFDNMGRFENNDKTTVGFDWNLLCDDFAPFIELICPTEEYVEDICSMPFPFENRAVREKYCIPYFGEGHPECVQACINFVSAAGNRGGCCDYSCD